MHPHPLNRVSLTEEKSLKTLVENRSTYTLEKCELNVFETYAKAEMVELTFGDLVLTSMLRGKKVMHLYEKPGFDYLPGESVIVPPNETMRIDFPEAKNDNPTQCIALAISAEQIRQTLHLLNEKYPKAEDNDEWEIDANFFHLHNTQQLSDIINRFVNLSITDKSIEKDIIAELALKELLIRLMQTQARTLMETSHKLLMNHHRLAYVVTYIKEHIRENLNVDLLADKACMSRPHFFRSFKQELGYSPTEFIVQERINLARTYLRNPATSVTQACYQAGFNNLNYFIRAFKNATGLTPRAFQQSMQH